METIVLMSCGAPHFLTQSSKADISGVVYQPYQKHKAFTIELGYIQ